MISQLRRLIPRPLLLLLLPLYHFFFAFTGAVIYRFPSRELTVIGITGTKGKTTTAEILNSILEQSGAKTALLGTLRFKIGEKNERNMRKMTMPGRFFIQKFLRDAVEAGCTHAVIEMTSEGAVQFRQRFIDMDALIFTNLAPEHIESHGSFEAYREAKLSIARTLARSSKNKRYMVANSDDEAGKYFLEIPNIAPIPFSKRDGEPMNVDEKNTQLFFQGSEIHSELGGVFNALNILAAATCAKSLGITISAIAQGVEKTTMVEGRMEKIDEGQTFPVIVDYAHTPDSLKAVYEAFKDKEKICVLGNTGGGRDKWKRKVMGEIADNYCSQIILTNEDPYDEDPMLIIGQIQEGINAHTPEIILDRRSAIARAIKLASQTKNSALLITGKGTDPFIMGPAGSKLPWDDADVTREELRKRGAVS